MAGVRGISRFRRHAAVMLLAAALPFSAVACSGGGSTADASGSSTGANGAETTATALDAGLKAQTSGDLVAAAAQYTKVLKFDKTNKFAFYNLALIDEANGNYGLAEGNYRAALKTDPKYEPALFNLAILRTTPNPKEAIALYQRAVAVDGKDAAALLNLGLLMRANGQRAAGDKNVLLAVAINPKLKDPEVAATGAGVKTPAVK